ncbi:hypothetical protein DH86_00000723 [Scytalidium sp. 3C]|nr:hypothetical protein DH86_00000723 [Scytalidium sp. 3C]
MKTHETTAPEVHHTTSSPVETHAPTTSKPADAATTKHATSSSKSTGLPSSIVPPSSTLGLGGPLVVASSTTPLLIDTASPTASRSEATSNSATPAASSGGMSAGGKAGLAIGIICIVGVRKDAQNAERLDDEKAATAFAAAGAPRSQTTTQPTPAPARLSLRPVTQFGQFFSGAAAGAATGAAAGAAAAPKSQAPANFPNSQISPQDSKENPFGNHAETIDATNAKGPAIVQAVGPGGEVLAGAAAAGAVVGLARAQSKRENAKPMDLTKKDPFRGPPSPAMTDYSVSEVASNAPQAQDKTGAAIAAAGGPANSAVHRVQLDFKPSLEDELELQAGQLIRLLHEYDDGWALCIRLDRSQQGVVPRTCLSVRPVKPRPPQNGPRGPPQPGMRGPGPQARPTPPGVNQGPRPMSPAQGRPGPPGMKPGPRPMSPAQGRPMSPAMSQGPRPMSPAQGRPMSPAMNQGPRPMSPAMKQAPRPMSPAQPRPMSPAQNRPMTPNGEGRPASPAQQQARRLTPPGQSPMNPSQQAPSASPPAEQRTPVGRKPVPGQAM